MFVSGMQYKKMERWRGQTLVPARFVVLLSDTTDNTPYFLVRELFTLKFWNLAQGTVRSPRWIMVAFPRGGKDVRRKDSSGKWECPALPAPSLQGTDVLNGRHSSDLPSDSSVWDLLISYMFHHSYINNVGKFLNVFQLKTLKKSPWSPPPRDMPPHDREHQLCFMGPHMKPPAGTRWRFALSYLQVFEFGTSSAWMSLPLTNSLNFVKQSFKHF